MTEPELNAAVCAGSGCDGLPSVAVRTFGCKVNQVESEEILAALLSKGFVLAEETRADVVVINTCTVTGEADRKARKLVRHVLGLPSAPVVVVTGCAAATAGETLAALGARVVVETDKNKVAARVAQAVGRVAAPSPATLVVRAGRGFHARAMIKVEDGCDAFCAYCIVPFARGVPRSVPLPDVVAQVERLLAQGVAEIVVTGINVGRYDHEGARLPELVRAIAATGVPRIRLSSIEPDDVTHELLSVIGATPAFCEHLHVPLQSGSDAVLQRMSRRYSAAGYADVIATVRAALPAACITTDVIAGFPGETEQQAEETLAFCEGMGFGKLHVFRYSRRAGTPAAEMDAQVEAVEASRRASKLRELGERLRTSWIDGTIGSFAEVLVERVTSTGSGLVVAGTARDYTKVAADIGEDVGVSVGSLVRVTVVARDGETAVGVPAQAACKAESDRI